MNNDTDLNALAVLLGNLIEKYADKLDLQNLPEPPDSPKRPTD